MTSLASNPQDKHSPNKPIEAHTNPYEDVLFNEHIWTEKDIGSNAISGILNEPAAQENIFSAGLRGLKGIDAQPVIPPTPIRKVRIQEFEPHLKSLSDVIDKYQLNKVLGMAAIEGIPELGSVTETLDLYSAGYKEYDDLTARVIGPLASKGISKVQRTRMLSANVPPLSTIPAIFSDAGFQLANPHTFSAVCEYADITGVNSTESATTNRILQDKLTHYLDTIEVHLLKEISRRSSSFFAALANLQSLHNETEACVEKIKQLRTCLATVSQKSAKNGLEVIRLKTRSGNLGTLYGTVNLLIDIKQTQPMIQVLLGQADYVGCLDLIEDTAMILRGGEQKDAEGAADEHTEVIEEGIKLVRSKSAVPKNMDLRGIKSLTHLSGQLAELSHTVSLIMENEFRDVLIKDWRDAIAKMVDESIKHAKNPGVPKSKSTNNILELPMMANISNIIKETFEIPFGTPKASTIFHQSSLSSDEEILRVKLMPLVMGLLRMDKLLPALSSYKTTVIKEAKAQIKVFYPEISIASPETPSSADVESAVQLAAIRKKEYRLAVSKQLKSMSFDSFYSLIVKVYIKSLNVLQRVATQKELIARIISEAETSGIVIGVSNINQIKAASTTTTPVPLEVISARRNVMEDDDDESIADLTEFLGEPQQKIAKGDLSKLHLTGSDSALEGSTSTFAQMTEGTTELMTDICDAVNIKCTKLIFVRSEQNAMLNPLDFYRLFGATWEFMQGVESFSGKTTFGVKNAILSQAKSFISHFHEEKSKQIAILVENEQWAQAEIPIDFQHITEQLQMLHRTSVDSIKRQQDEDNLREMTEGVNDSDKEDAELDLASSAISKSMQDEDEANQTDQATSDQKKSLRFLLVDGQRYYVVGSVLLFLKMLVEYMNCASSLPVITTDILNRILEFLKLFNSRTCQVILGAGAMRSAGLKNITARHIALAAQSLGIVIAIIPYIKKGISQFLPSKQQVLLNDFDRIHRDYRDHQSELYIKLVTIMNERLDIHSAKLVAISWDSPDSKDISAEESVTVHMAVLVKETTTLHKVLAKYLPAESLRSIMGEVFRTYVKKLEEDLKKIDLFSSAGKNRLLMDVQYFIRQLSSLDGIDGPGNHLEVCVNNTRIKDRRTVPVNSATLRANAGGNSNLATPASSTMSSGASPIKPAMGGTPANPQNQQAKPASSQFAYNFGKMLRSQNDQQPPH